MVTNEKMILELLDEKTDQKTGICCSSMICLTKETGKGVGEITHYLKQLKIKGVFILLDGNFYDKKNGTFQLQISPTYLQSNINK